MKNKIISLIIKILILSLFLSHSHSSEKIWQSAKEGNKIIFIRHSLAPGGGDPEGFKIDDCKTQRNLNLKGINQSKRIGKLFKKKKIKVEALENYDFKKAKITIFTAGSLIAKKWAPIAAKKKIVIDNSKYFRRDKNINIVVPEVNESALKIYKKRNIISNPNC